MAMSTAPWSKLERRLRDLPDPALDMRFRFTVYRQDAISTPHPTDPASKFWITLGRVTLWAVPSDRHSGDKAHVDFSARRGPSWLPEIAFDYLAVPRHELLDWTPPWNGWGLVDILKACDHRIGRRRWAALRSRINEPAALHLLELRSGSPARAPALAGRRTDEMHDPR
jgi:hypothetical protein